MHETAEDLDRLQSLLDRSHAASGKHLRSAFDQSNKLSANQLAGHLGGILELHLGVLSGSGAPLVAPLDAIFYRGRIWIGLPSAALRSQLVRLDPRVSASYNTEKVALIAHGVAVEPPKDSRELGQFSTLMRQMYAAVYGQAWREWFERSRSESGRRDFTGYIEPTKMFAKGSAE